MSYNVNLIKTVTENPGKHVCKTAIYYFCSSQRENQLLQNAHHLYGPPTLLCTLLKVYILFTYEQMSEALDMRRDPCSLEHLEPFVQEQGLSHHMPYVVEESPEFQLLI